MERMLTARSEPTFTVQTAGPAIRLAAVAVCASFWVGVAYLLI